LNRFSRFARNVGWRGTIRSLFVAAFVVILGLAKPKEVELLLFAPIAVACFLVTYPIRNILVAHVRASEIALGFVAIAIVGTSILLGKVMPKVPREHPEILIALAAALGLYMGSYFWLHSDPRVERLDH